MTNRAFVCTKLLLTENTYLESPRGYGAVDVRPPGVETLRERRALEKSLTAWAESVNLSNCMRLTTVVDGRTPLEAEDIAVARFEEALDVFHQEFFFVQAPRLSSAGIITPLATGKPEAILPQSYTGAAVVFQRRHALIEELSQDQMLLAVPSSDVVVRLKRAAHWARLASVETNPVLQVVFRWFLLEGLCNFAKTDPAASSRALMAIGVFPKSFGKTNQELLQEIGKAIPSYWEFSRGIRSDMKDLEQLRHSTVHDAARTMEVNKDLLRRSSRLTTLLAPRVKKRLMDVFFEHQPASIEKAWELVEAQVTSDPHLVTNIRNFITLFHRP